MNWEDVWILCNIINYQTHVFQKVLMMFWSSWTSRRTGSDITLLRYSAHNNIHHVFLQRAEEIPPDVTQCIKVEIMKHTMWARASTLIMQITSVHLRLIKLQIGLNNFLNADESPRWFISVNAEDARLQQQHRGSQTLSCTITQTSERQWRQRFTQQAWDMWGYSDQ